MNALFDAWRAAEPTTCVPFVHTAPNAPPSSAPTPLVSTLAHALLAAHNAPTLVTASFSFFFFSLFFFHPLSSTSTFMIRCCSWRVRRVTDFSYNQRP
jgi:hypothetical protein